jgi:predicted DNA-binding transcriptional regulator AlpA
MKTKLRMNAVSYAHMIKMMMEGTRTCAELAEETGLSTATIYDYTRELHKKKAAYIATWEPDTLGRDAKPVYMLGKGKDAVRKKLSAAERTRNYRERHRIGTEPRLVNWLRSEIKTNWVKV